MNIGMYRHVFAKYIDEKYILLSSANLAPTVAPSQAPSAIPSLELRLTPSAMPSLEFISY